MTGESYVELRDSYENTALEVPMMLSCCNWWRNAGGHQDCIKEILVKTGLDFWKDDFLVAKITSHLIGNE